MFAVLISCVAYEQGRRIGDIPISEIRSFRRPGCFVWVAIRDPDPSEVEALQAEFDLHDLAVEDAQRGHQRPKLDEYGSTLFAGSTSGVFRSTNDGGNWAKVTNGLPDRVTALAFTISGTKLLAGTVYGYYVSEDNGATWRGSSTGLLNLQVSGLVVQDDRVIAGTRSAGIFVRQLE